MNPNEIEDFLNGFDPDTASEEEFSNFCSQAKDKIGAEIVQAAKDHPEASPVLEILAKLLCLVTEPDQYIRNDDLIIPGFGEYHFSAAPLLDDNYGVIVSLQLEDGTQIGPAAIHNDKDLNAAERSMHEFKRIYAETRPTKIYDINTNATWDKTGVFLPYTSDAFKCAFHRF